jgi:N-acetylglucosamine-6-phosphate deacetylase
LIILCDHIFNEEKEGFTPGEIFIEGSRFAAQGSGEKLDYRDCFALPGFIDLHTHGGFGKAYMEIPAEEIDKIAVYIASTGVSAFCPTTVSGAADACRRGMEEAAKSKSFRPDGNFHGAQIIGIYQEGPFLSPEKPGVADLASFRRPDPEYFKGLCSDARDRGLEIKFVVIAPELEGAPDFIREASKTAICTMAHTTADYETAKEAIKNGAAQITHLFNAMPPLLHREPGIIGAAFDSEGVKAELIADGEHVHPAVVRAAFKMFGDDRIILISDSLFSGLPDGSYSAAGLTVQVKNGAAKNSQGALAGASKTLGQCVINAVKNIGIPLYSAVKCAAANPAKQAGMFAKRGSISPGKTADLVILEKDYTIREVIIRGVLLGEEIVRKEN